MSKTIKVYRHKKDGTLRTGRIDWKGNFPTDTKGFKANGYRKLTTAGDEFSVEYDVYTNDKDWLVDICLFEDHLACIKITNPLTLLSTLDQISRSSASIAKAINQAR